MKKVIRLKPKPVEVLDISIKTPKHINSALFQAGYEHGLTSNILTNFRTSFMLGFRQAKLELRAKQNLHSLPRKMRFKVLL